LSTLKKKKLLLKFALLQSQKI